MKEERSLMFQVLKTLRAEMLLFGKDMVEWTSNGKFYMSMLLRQSQRKDSMQTSVSTLTDHSISFLGYLNIDTSTWFPKTLLSRQRIQETHKYGSSNKNPEPLNLNQTWPGHSIFKTQEDQPTCRCITLTQDGGNSSNSLVNNLSMWRTTKYSMFKEEKIKKAQMLLFITDTMVPTRDGR